MLRNVACLIITRSCVFLFGIFKISDSFQLYIYRRRRRRRRRSSDDNILLYYARIRQPPCWWEFASSDYVTSPPPTGLFSRRRRPAGRPAYCVGPRAARPPVAAARSRALGLCEFSCARFLAARIIRIMFRVLLLALLMWNFITLYYYIYNYIGCPSRRV